MPFLVSQESRSNGYVMYHYEAFTAKTPKKAAKQRREPDEDTSEPNLPSYHKSPSSKSSSDLRSDKEYVLEYYAVSLCEPEKPKLRSG